MIEFLFAINAFICFLDAIQHENQTKGRNCYKIQQRRTKKVQKKHIKTIKVKVVKK